MRILPQVSAAGQVEDFLMDSTGQHVSTMASVTQKGSRLYMGEPGAVVHFIPGPARARGVR